MRVRLALAVSACLLGICAGGNPPRNATIFFDGSSFNPPEVEIDAGGFLTVKTSEGPGSTSMFGQAFEVIVPDNWHDVDGIGLRLIEMQDDTVANRCNTGAFYSGYESMWKKAWGQHPKSPFKRGLARRAHDLMPSADDGEQFGGSYLPGVYYARRTWGNNEADPICRRLDPFPQYFKLTVV